MEKEYEVPNKSILEGVVENANTTEEEEEEEETEVEDTEEENTEDSISESIDKLIKEAKKRKVSEVNEHHFLKFLNKTQIDSFYQFDLQ
jgi:hypothetical protein